MRTSRPLREYEWAHVHIIYTCIENPSKAKKQNAIAAVPTAVHQKPNEPMRGEYRRRPNSKLQNQEILKANRRRRRPEQKEAGESN